MVSAQRHGASVCLGLPDHSADQPISCPAYQGWVAGSSSTGDPWLEPATGPDCPEPPLTLEQISESGYTLRIVCWSGQELTFRAWWPTIPEEAGLGGVCREADEPAGFLFCQNINYNGITASEAEGFVSRLHLSIDPASGVTMPERGRWIAVTGHFDDPAAEHCGDLTSDEEPDADALVFRCRLEFVPTSASASDP